MSRAARTPTRLERTLHVDFAAFPSPTGQLVVLGLRGGADLKTEHTNAFEVGYRIEPKSGLTFDATVFYNDYNDLRTENAVTKCETAGGPPRVTVLRQYASGATGRSAGAEVLTRWQVTRTWRIDANYSRLHTVLENLGTTPEAITLSRRDPNQQWQVRSQLDVIHAWQLDASLARVGRLQSIDVPAYNRVDVRLGGPILPSVNLSIVGQNLLQARHWEFGGFEGVMLNQVNRSGYLKLTWQF